MKKCYKYYILYVIYYEVGCQSPAAWNESNQIQGLSCKFDDDEKSLLT